MKVSTKGDYGIRALIELAHRYGEARPTQSSEIAARQKVLYHAAAVFGSNYVAALLDIAEGLIGVEHARGDIAALAERASLTCSGAR